MYGNPLTIFLVSTVARRKEVTPLYTIVIEECLVLQLLEHNIVLEPTFELPNFMETLSSSKFGEEKRNANQYI